MFHTSTLRICDTKNIFGNSFTYFRNMLHDEVTVLIDHFKISFAISLE